MKQIIQTIFFLCLFTPLQGQDLYDLDSLRSIHIEFENPDWEATLIDNWYAQTGVRELATVEMNGILYDSVAIRYKGNSTFYIADDMNNPKKPLNIDMNEYLSGQKLLGYSKVKLSNSFFDPTIVRDVLAFGIYGNYMPAPAANWMKVYIEDEYIGLYSNTESINNPFLTKHFDYKKGVLFKCDPESQFGSTTAWQSANLAWYGADSTNYYNRYELKSDEGWAELLNLMDILNNNPDELESVLNIDRVLWYLAVSQVIANYDSYNGFFMHNYYLYQHKNGLFQILPWDVSESFVGGLLGYTNLSDNQIYQWDIFNEGDPFNENRPLVDYVANHPVYRKQYLAHIRTVIAEVLDETALLNTMQDMHLITAAAAADDNNAFLGNGDTYFESNLTTDVNLGFSFQVAGIMSTVEKRKDHLLNDPEVSLSAPSISQVNRNLEFPQPGESVSVSAFVDNGTQVDLMVTINEYASHFEAIPMLDDGMHNDGAADDGVFGAFIPHTNLDDAIKYYIRAQNDDAMMLDPQRAEYEFHEYVVGQTTANNNLDTTSSSLSISPNPVSEKTTITLENNWQGDLQIRIINMLGQVQADFVVKKTSAAFQLDLDTHLFPQGSYKVLMSNGDEMAITSFVKI